MDIAVDFYPYQEQFDKLIEKTRAITEIPELGEKESIFSDNRKTGFSINFPVTLTCRPSKICGRECYASNLAKPITWKNSLLKQLRIYQYFLRTPTKVVADRIIEEYHRRKLDWIRWCGSGDLFPEAVKVINVIAKKDPSVKMLVVSRKPELVNKLVDLPSLFIMFSLDSSCLDRKEQLKPNSRIYFSFLRVHSDEDTQEAQIIFNEQKLKHQLPNDHPARCCPVDTGNLAVLDGCNKCKKCFSERVFSLAEATTIPRN